MRYEVVRDYGKMKIGNVVVIAEDAAFDLVNNGLIKPIAKHAADLEPKKEVKVAKKKASKKKASKKV